jgi:gliding motility-associated-like protein
MRRSYCWLIGLAIFGHFFGQMNPLVERLSFYFGQPQSIDEICDNAIDDDGDGLIDLNDPDCDCPIFGPKSLIPNPSFEEKSCCPQAVSELSCAKTWIQASEPTTDYLHTCGWMGWPNLPPPLPFPDGQGCVGFRNGRFRGGITNANWKEYAGACLLSPMKANTSYRLRFKMGFVNETNSPPTTIVLFGTTDCVNLPFGKGNPEFGCPTNGPGWVQLGNAYVSGNRSWINIDLNFTPKDDIYAIVLGPSCALESSSVDVDIYYFLDDLILDELKRFDFTISTLGNPCGSDYSLQVPAIAQTNYQWYKDGIALPGEKLNKLLLKTGPGDYRVRLTGTNECRLLQPYNFQKPVARKDLKKRLCLGESLAFNRKKINQTGVYFDTLKTIHGCDSIINLELSIATDLIDSVKAGILPGESFSVAGKNFQQAGNFQIPLTSRDGCDSLVFLELSFLSIYIPSAFSPNQDNVNDVFTVFGGQDIKKILALKVYDRWGGLVYTAKDLSPNDLSTGWNGQRDDQPLPEGIYTYWAILLLDDELQHQIKGSVQLLR